MLLFSFIQLTSITNVYPAGTSSLAMFSSFSARRQSRKSCSEEGERGERVRGGVPRLAAGGLFLTREPAGVRERFAGVAIAGGLTELTTIACVREPGGERDRGRRERAGRTEE